ncbi:MULTISPECIES: IS701 family transposase [Streptomyces]|uniref:Putative regulatory protein n=1 Tax=Streptomyces eurythermus TaxID=42237 RepID=A8WDN1_9ACTN|nr:MULTISPECIES: transposase [Streptomyces]ABW91154.1 putative regulatory protein [Streptomyces eurythermus]MBK3522458.1 transposase [Streptomyces sp. MBT70]GGR86021.1 putative ISXo8 transposase [Streptomyces eurythermus]
MGTLTTAPTTPHHPAHSPEAHLTEEVCASVLASLRRRDQRHKGRLYVNGLLTARGRKTMRNLATSTREPAAAQSLHHFISVSTWDWSEVRASLARRMERLMTPHAWVVQPMVTPKSGVHSVGVQRRFIRHLGQAVTSQHSHGLWLAGQSAAAPVNWQLSVGEDRPGAPAPGVRDGVPETVGGGWSGDDTAISVVLQAASWGLTPRPVVIDARDVPPAPLIEAFTAADLPFLLRVGGNTPLLAPDLSSGQRRVLSASAEHLTTLARSQQRPVEWVDPAVPRVLRTGLVALLPVLWPGVTVPRRPRPAGVRVVAPRRSGGAELLLMGEWQPNRRRVAELWLTNMTGAGRGTLLRLSKLTRRADTDFARICMDVGAQDFEGRSYHGWHRHMTMVSLAHAVRVLTREHHAGEELERSG